MSLSWLSLEWLARKSSTIFGSRPCTADSHKHNVATVTLRLSVYSRERSTWIFYLVLHDSIWICVCRPCTADSYKHTDTTVTLRPSVCSRARSDTVYSLRARGYFSRPIRTISLLPISCNEQVQCKNLTERMPTDFYQVTTRHMFCRLGIHVHSFPGLASYTVFERTS